MNEQDTDIRSVLAAEIERVPEEFLPTLLTIVHSFRESVALNDAEESFEQGWKETLKGEYKPVDDLWEGIEHWQFLESNCERALLRGQRNG